MILVVFPHTSVKNNSVRNRWGRSELTAYYPRGCLLFGCPSKANSEEKVLAVHPRACWSVFNNWLSGKKNKSKNKPSLVCRTRWFPWCNICAVADFKLVR